MEARIWSFGAALAALGLMVGLAVAAGDLRPPEERAEAEAPGPCADPIRWRVGSIDPRLGLSPEEAEGAVEEAASLWETAAGRRLFAHDRAEGLPIRFVRGAHVARDAQAGAGARGVEAGAHRRVIEEGGRGVTVVGEEILVFRFDDRSELVKILAHELGHALGFGHVDGPGAIMSAEYEREGGQPGPTALVLEDVELLRALSCP